MKYSYWSKQIPVTFLLLLVSICPSRAEVNAEILSFGDGNWSGDAHTLGGLDDGLPGDADALIVSANRALGYPSSAFIWVNLENDYSRNAFVEMTVGYRVNPGQTTSGTVLWDGSKVQSWSPSGEGERLAEVSFLLSTSEYDFRQGKHALEIRTKDLTGNDTDWFQVDSVRISRIGETMPPLVPAPTDWLLVIGENMGVAELNNLHPLQREVSDLLGYSLPRVFASQLTETQKQTHHLILVGRYSANSLAREILDAHGDSDPFASEPAFVQEQGYTVGVHPDGLSPGRTVITAIGWGELGAVYAMSHLRTNFQYLDDQLVLQTGQRIFKPDIEERAIYYNIAYGGSFENLTPDLFQEEDWEYWIDKHVCSQLTHIYFFLWGNLELYYPKSPISSTERNRRLHESLQHMILYAHTRGLKVHYMFVMTLVPYDIFDANITRLPNLKASSVYADWGSEVVCQAEPGQIVLGNHTWNGALDLMVDAYGNEIVQFKEADGYIVTFYDPGGCWCGPNKYDCKGLQDQRLMEQTQAISERILSINPDADICAFLWPIWELESSTYIGWRYRDGYLNRLKTYFAQDMDRITVLDTVTRTDSTLVEARQKGFRLNGFLFATNVETAYVFVNPMLKYISDNVGFGRNYGVSALSFHRNEEGGKYPNSYIASQMMWDIDRNARDVVRDYCRWIANTNTTAQEKLYQAFLLLDEFHCNGSATQDLEAKGQQIRSLISTAIARLPERKQTELEWLKTTGEAIAIFGKAVESKNDPDIVESQRALMYSLLNNSPTFKSAAWMMLETTRFTKYLDYIHAGFDVSNY